MLIGTGALFVRVVILTVLVVVLIALVVISPNLAILIAIGTLQLRFAGAIHQFIVGGLTFDLSPKTPTRAP